MSVLYSVLSFAEIAPTKRSEFAAYLASFSLEYPVHAERSRNPTQEEVENAIRIFPIDDFATEYYRPDRVSSDEPWKSVVVRQLKHPHWNMEINTLKIPADKQTPCGIYLNGKPEMNYRLLERVAHDCGPLLSIANGEYDAVIFHYKDSEVDPPPSYCQGHSFVNQP